MQLLDIDDVAPTVEYPPLGLQLPFSTARTIAPLQSLFEGWAINAGGPHPTDKTKATITLISVRFFLKLLNLHIIDFFFLPNYP